MNYLMAIVVIALYACSDPSGCEYSHEEVEQVAGRAYAPTREVFHCDNGITVRKPKEVKNVR